MNSIAYDIKNLKFNYPKGFTLSVNELHIFANKITGITGLNGSGKSTLLKILAFLLNPDFEKFNFFKQSITRNQYHKLRQNVTMLLQNPILLQRSIYHNIAYGLKVRSQKNIKQKVYDVLQKVGFNDNNIAHKNFNELSGGEIKRVALAARIALNPQVLLLDEPTTNVDKVNKKIIFDSLKTLHADNNTTIIVSSHDEQWLNKIADEIICL